MADEPAKIDPKSIPPASFSLLVTTLASQAMMSLGKLPNPQTGQSEVQPLLAKHFIDTLGLLEDKTKGNLTAEESQLLGNVTHELRMQYAQVKK
jgi:hypothetical protein